MNAPHSWSRRPRLCLRKFSIANRGEIALRVIRACRELGIETVAIYSEADRDSLHVWAADEAYLRRTGPSARSYLNIPISSARRCSRESTLFIPDTDILSERAHFAEICETHGIKFIGPPARASSRWATRSRPKEAMAEAGVPVIPGSRGPVWDDEEALAHRRRDRLSGHRQGRRRGRRQGHAGRRTTASELLRVLQTGPQRGASRLRQRRRLHRKGDREPQAHRDPSAGRRAREHRSPGRAGVLPPAPAPEGVRGGARRPRSTPSCGKRWARRRFRPPQRSGTPTRAPSSFSWTAAGNFYFLEMNTRIQVEHPVTEWVTGIDLVKEQIRIAAGDRSVSPRRTFRWRAMPSSAGSTRKIPSGTFCLRPGGSLHYHAPGRPWRAGRLRGRTAGSMVPPYYDPLLAKLIVHGNDRE